MNILYIGAGFVGTCSAAVSADSGHGALVYDINKERIRKLSSGKRDVIESCLFEDGLAELLIRCKKNITFTNSAPEMKKFIDRVDAIFMCLPTPEKAGEEGQSNLSYYEAACETLAKMLSKRQGGKQSSYVVIINKSTLPISMIDRTKEILEAHKVKNFGIVSNPEFLVEGKAVYDSIHPDRVVIGAENEKDFKIMRALYQRFYTSSSVKYIEVNPHEAEAGKLLANFMLFSRLALCFDVIGRTCESFPRISFERVRDILKIDPRIAPWGLYDSLYAGGSCFIKDAASLAYQLESAGGNAELVRGVLGANNYQLDHFLSRIHAEAHAIIKGVRIALFGAAFKQHTNDVRNSGAIRATEFFLQEGAQEIKVYDPAATDEFKRVFNPKKDAQYKKITYTKSEDACLKSTSMAFIATDWPQFQSLAEIIQKTVKAPYLIMDGRRMLCNSYNNLQSAGFSIIAVGSQFMKGKKV
ncbi:UDP-glucose/GDP-mannose dehydrogenase family protein [Candidatus Peregrinibacteria bacterium]|nr:UDP-glucose/GDP-mannose dehydrogenase family protein [Candidatus Peregrinibacteria bacterium]